MSKTIVQTPPQAVGVKCPADDPEWSKTHDCNDCEHQSKCYGAVMGALGL